MTAPIIGPRTIEQLDHSLRALKVKLSAETMDQPDEIPPGPGGPAPEAFAWLAQGFPERSSLAGTPRESARGFRT